MMEVFKVFLTSCDIKSKIIDKWFALETSACGSQSQVSPAAQWRISIKLLPKLTFWQNRLWLWLLWLDEVDGPISLNEYPRGTDQIANSSGKYVGWWKLAAGSPVRGTMLRCYARHAALATHAAQAAASRLSILILILIPRNNVTFSQLRECSTGNNENASHRRMENV